MTATEGANIIGQLAIFVTAITGLIVSLRNSARIEQVHLATNSLQDKLVESTKSASKAEGKEEERLEERERQTHKLPPFKP